MCHGFDSRPEYLVLTRVGFNTHGSGGVVVTYNLANMNSFFFFFGCCYCTVVVLLIIRSIEPRAVHHGHTQCIEHAMAKGGEKKGKRKKSSGSICVAFCIRNRDCRYKYVLLCHTRKWGTPRCAHHQPLRKKKAGNTGTINRPFALTYVSLNQL